MKYLTLVLKGMGYGITHIVPGLGGGLILILMGIYEPFVEALGNILVRPQKWREYLLFLIPLGIGMVIGMVILARLITLVLDRYPSATLFFFMGLLLGTIPPVLKMHADMKLTVARGAALLLGALLVLGFKFIRPNDAGEQALLSLGDYVYNGFVCFLAGGASVTPGLDGSYVLLLGGTYGPVIEAVGMLGDLVIRWGVLISTALGAVLGIMIFSKLIDTAIKHVPAVSYYCILGLILGSVYGLWPAGPHQGGILVLLAAFVVGVIVALILGREPQRAPSGKALTEGEVG